MTSGPPDSIYNAWWVLGSVAVAVITALATYFIQKMVNRPKPSSLALPTGDVVDTTGVPMQMVQIIATQSKMLQDATEGWTKAEKRVDALEERVAHLEDENGTLVRDNAVLLGDARVWALWYDGGQTPPAPGPSNQTRNIIAVAEGHAESSQQVGA